MFVLPAQMSRLKLCSSQKLSDFKLTFVYLSPQPYYSTSHAAIFGVLSFLHPGLLTANMGLCTILLWNNLQLNISKKVFKSITFLYVVCQKNMRSKNCEFGPWERLILRYLYNAVYGVIWRQLCVQISVKLAVSIQRNPLVLRVSKTT